LSGALIQESLDALGPVFGREAERFRHDLIGQARMQGRLGSLVDGLLANSDGYWGQGTDLLCDGQTFLIQVLQGHGPVDQPEKRLDSGFRRNDGKTSFQTFYEIIKFRVLSFRV
jgi:hypothetical protein